MRGSPVSISTLFELRLCSITFQIADCIGQEVAEGTVGYGSLDMPLDPSL